MPTLKTIEGEDLSTLILGLPEEERQGERINSPADQAKSERESRANLPVIPLMIIPVSSLSWLVLQPFSCEGLNCIITRIFVFARAAAPLLKRS